MLTSLCNLQESGVHIIEFYGAYNEYPWYLYNDWSRDWLMWWLFGSTIGEIKPFHFQLETIWNSVFQFLHHIMIYISYSCKIKVGRLIFCDFLTTVKKKKSMWCDIVTSESSTCLPIVWQNYVHNYMTLRWCPTRPLCPLISKKNCHDWILLRKIILK